MSISLGTQFLFFGLNDFFAAYFTPIELFFWFLVTAKRSFEPRKGVTYSSFIKFDNRRIKIEFHLFGLFLKEHSMTICNSDRWFMCVKPIPPSWYNDSFSVLIISFMWLISIILALVTLSPISLISVDIKGNKDKICKAIWSRIKYRNSGTAHFGQVSYLTF